MSTMSRIHSRRDFREWGSRFDAELKKLAAKIAWRTLLDHDCDPNALKSALYYAVDHLRLANDAHHGNEFEITREEILAQVAQLKKTICQLMALRIQGNTVASTVIYLWELKKEEMRFFQCFPTLLVQFEKILKILKLPRARRDTLEDWLVASGESLLHAYVKEVTSKTFSEEIAELLEAAAAAGGFDCRREYSTEAVSRRHRRFRHRKESDYEGMKTLVGRLKAHKETFLDEFLEQWKERLDAYWCVQQLLLWDDGDPQLCAVGAMQRTKNRHSPA